MNNSKNTNIFFGVLVSIMVIMTVYVCYVIGTATRISGCTDTYERCILSHTETTQRYWGK